MLIGVDWLGRQSRYVEYIICGSNNEGAIMCESGDQEVIKHLRRLTFSKMRTCYAFMVYNQD